MKIQDTDALAQPDPLRRKLLLGLHGMALGTPLGIGACGGTGDGSSDKGSSDAKIDTIVAKLPKLERSAQAVRVALASGSAVALASTNLVSAHNVSQVAADGSAGVITIGGAPQMSYLFDAGGQLLLMSVIEDGVRTTIDSRGTAEALLLVTSEVALQGPAMAIALRRALASSNFNTVVEPLRLAVEAAQGRKGIDPSDTELMNALKAATLRLRGKSAAAPASASRERALSVTVSPSGAKSGITILPTEDFNTVVLQNQFRRRTHAWIARSGSYDAAGTLTPVAPAVAVVDFPLDATTALSFDNIVTNVGDYIAQFYADIGFLGAYESGSAVWTPVKSAPVQLPFAPDGAQTVVHTVRVVGISAFESGTLSDAENRAYEQILWDTLIEDIAKPFMRTLVLPMVNEHVAKLGKLEFQQASWALVLNGLTDLSSLAVGGQFFPNTIAALRAGQFKTAISSFLTEFFSSNTFQGLYEAGFRAWMRASSTNWTLRDGSGTLIGVNLLSQEDLVARNVAALRGALDKLARIIQLIKVATLVGDYAAIGKDMLASARMTEFTLNISKAKTSLSPNPFQVAATSGQFPITVKVDGLDAAVPPSSVFVQWSCRGKYGTLYQVGGIGTNTFESALTIPTHNYVPSGIEGDPADPDTITATAYYRNPATNSHGRIEMGKASVSVEFKREFSVSISPNSTDVPSGIDLPMTAFLNEKLPAGSTVDWQWSHAGVGSLQAVAPDGNPADSQATFSTGSSEGTATLTVQATVRVPASDPKGARTIQTQPVSTTLKVKKGVRTITFVASGGSFSFACASSAPCFYGAFLVPIIPGAINYTAVFTDFAYGGCNRSLSWTTGRGDGGGCEFPITYHPFRPAQVVTNTWAVWMGFSDTWNPGNGKCTVTITLPA